MKKYIKTISIVAILILLAGWYFIPRLLNSASEEPVRQISPSGIPGGGGGDGRGFAPGGGGRGGAALNVNVYIVEPTYLADKIKTVGTVRADEEVDLTFETSGKIVKIYFTEGTQVKKGDLLAKVNDRPLQAQLLKLQAQQKLAEDRLFRQRALLDKDAVSRENYETVFTNLETINADIQLVEANIAQTELRAPFDGIVGLRFVSEGAFATPQTKITKLTKIEPLKIEFSVPEAYSEQVSNGTNIVFGMHGSLKSYSAKVYAQESKVDESMRTLALRAYYNNKGHEITPGRYVNVEINLAEIKNAIAIPSEAVVPEMGKDMVYKSVNGVAEPIQVQTGLRTPSQVQITDGLKTGDTIVVSGVLQLRRGTPLKIERVVTNADLIESN